MASLLRRLHLPSRRWKPLNFPKANFPRVPADTKIDEEQIRDYVAERYYPTHIGEILRDRYQIVGKLGFGVTSTVWLARDMEARRHVALKVYIRAQSLGSHVDHEVAMYTRIANCNTDHPGRHAIRDLLDSFDITGPDGSHRCLVHTPLWDNMYEFLNQGETGRLTPMILAFTLRQIFLALDFLHTECQMIHTDIKADNIMFGISDYELLTNFEQDELKNPSPRKVVDEKRTIYTSCRIPIELSQIGLPVLCDLGSVVTADVEHTEDIQPDYYRSPEVILEVPWSFPVDIWNVGCMVWTIFEDGNLFSGKDPELGAYRSRAHLAEMIALLGEPPKSLLDKGQATDRFFTETGEFRNEVPIPERKSLEDLETTLLEGEQADRAKFLALMRKMLQWDPSKRATAGELLEDEWIVENLQSPE
ncbi:CMGC SRPK kinase [Rhypophila decipiens]|uniref:non-specific serine/threonine protein kinase n=1 Tax=Rhypophila decipiens TaxID=261697 RepID=A0AAN6XXZ1_9PEZI|nr:CMGC SRPK kinase [Rhypophila decipiens]